MTITTATIIIGALIGALGLLIILGFGGLYVQLNDLKQELRKLPETPATPPEITVNFPFDSVLELQGKVGELTAAVFAVNRLMGLTANASAVNLSRILEKDNLAPNGVEAITSLRNTIMQTIHYFYGPLDDEGSEQKDEEK